MATEVQYSFMSARALLIALALILTTFCGEQCKSKLYTREFAEFVNPGRCTESLQSLFEADANIFYVNSLRVKDCSVLVHLCRFL